MLTTVSRIILRNRLVIIAILALFTAFMAYNATHVKLSYESAKLLSKNDSALLDYQDFKKLFGEDGNIYVIGAHNPEIFKLDQFKAWYRLGNDIRKIHGVEEVLSMTRTKTLVKNPITHRFDFYPVVSREATSQAEVDSLKTKILGLKFYEGLLFNPKTGMNF